MHPQLRAAFSVSPMTGFRPGGASALTVAVPFRIFPGFPILSEAFLPVYGALRRLFLIGFYSAALGLSRRQSVCRTAASEAEILHAFLLAHAESVAEVPDGVGGVVVGNVRAQRVHLFVPAFLAAAPVRTLRAISGASSARNPSIFSVTCSSESVVSVSSAYRVRSRSLKSSMPKEPADRRGDLRGLLRADEIEKAVAPRLERQSRS